MSRLLKKAWAMDLNGLSKQRFSRWAMTSSAGFTAVALLALSPGSIEASPCRPHDPGGVNPGTLCPIHPHTFMPNQLLVPGLGQGAFHGRPTNPLLPGQPIITSPLPQGFFTRVQTGDGLGDGVGVQVESSTGKVWSRRSGN
jgi:hypothetical protein